MSVAFEGIDRLVVTFLAGDVTAGKPVVMGGEGSDESIVRYIFVTVQYSGTTAPALGWTALVADSAGCLRAAGSGESGRMCLVVTRDSEKKTVGLFL